MTLRFIKPASEVIAWLERIEQWAPYSELGRSRSAVHGPNRLGECRGSGLTRRL